MAKYAVYDTDSYAFLKDVNMEAGERVDSLVFPEYQGSVSSTT